MMFPRRVQFQVLICGVIYLLATGCIPNSISEVDLSSTPDIGLTLANGNPQVEIEWTYRDARRFAVELSVMHYPLVRGFQTICPLTQLEIKSGTGERLLLYRNPEQISLDEFYAITQHSRWFCKKQAESDGFIDYLFSLTYYYDDEADLKWDENHTLSIDLGEVIATNSSSVITLPKQGTFDLPLDFETGSKNLTWLHPTTLLTNNGVLVEINRVAVNPSFALLDTCIEYQDHHFWQPIAIVLYQGQEAYSTEFIPTFPYFPYYPSDRASTLQSTRRCYSLIIPFDFPVDSLASFQIGIDQLQIVNTSPGVVTMQECEAVKEAVEKSYTGLKIRCSEFETNGQPQHWFEVLSHPPDISAQEAYKLMESAFTQTIFGPWYVEIH